MNTFESSSSPASWLARLEELLLESHSSTLSAEANAELNQILRFHPEARAHAARILIDDAALTDALREWQAAALFQEEGASLASLARQDRVQAPARSLWLRWRPLTAAAAGIVFGIFCTSMVFAYVAPLAARVLLRQSEGFESGPPPLVTGVPVDPGRWSGDYTEVVGPKQGVTPLKGGKMLRFLRADYEGKAEPEGSYIADLYQLVDLRPWQRDIQDGAAQVQLSASVNTFAFPLDERYDTSIGIYALSQETARGESARNDITLMNSSLAMARKSLPGLDRNPGTWQKMDTELRLPADTEFLLVRIGISYASQKLRRNTFEGHYLDEVALTLTHKNPLP